MSLESVWGATANDLCDRLLEAETPETRFCIVEQSLLAYAARPLAWHPAIAFALKEFQGMSSHPNTRTISDVTEHIGLSLRRFIQVFSEAVGLTPKLFCRTWRFQEVLASDQ